MKAVWSDKHDQPTVVPAGKARLGSAKQLAGDAFGGVTPYGVLILSFGYNYYTVVVPAILNIPQFHPLATNCSALGKHAIYL